jgi:hypothetical protein|nr:MAG TPA: hypothetical protein [Bacteriophage sp.]DAO69997.1 MAG TPA: hypothetical protein [Bacteriophage sp.]
MPIRDRKFYIHQYNQYMEEKQNALDGVSSGGSMDINAATDMAQSNMH